MKKSISSKPAGITQSYLPECESIRGIAIFLVVTFHVSRRWLNEHVETPGIFQSYILAGDTGVTLFFVLSGFLLSLPLVKSQNIDIKRFFRKRALRILPLYIVVISLGGIYHANFPAFLKALFFWDIRISTLPPFGSVGWSLMVEVQFYLLLPFLFLIFKNKATRPLMLLVFVFFVVCYMHITKRWDFISGDWSFGLNLRNTVFARWPAFLCGVLLAYLHQYKGEKIKNSCSNNLFLRFFGSDVLLLCVVIVLGFTLQRTAEMSIIYAYVYFFDRFMFEAALWVIVIALILYLPLMSRVLIVNPIWHFLGVISYSLYLWHIVVLDFAPRLMKYAIPSFAMLSDHQRLIISVLLSLLLSVVSYYVIERPFLVIKEKR